jgi:type II secretory pathway pseudopilin PulG
MANGEKTGICREWRRRADCGFAYLLVMVLVAGIGAALLKISDDWHQQTQRQREKQLLFAGRQIRQAIISYYENSPPQSPRFPRALEDLVRDPRKAAVARHLREIYRDPFTGTVDWGLVKSANGEIYGVYSRSTGEPLKKNNFRPAERQFGGASSYSEWIFVFTPGQYAAGVRNASEKSSK